MKPTRFKLDHPSMRRRLLHDLGVNCPSTIARSIGVPNSELRNRFYGDLDLTYFAEKLPNVDWHYVMFGKSRLHPESEMWHDQESYEPSHRRVQGGNSFCIYPGRRRPILNLIRSENAKDD